MSSGIDFRVQSLRAWLRIENGPQGVPGPGRKKTQFLQLSVGNANTMSQGEEITMARRFLTCPDYIAVFFFKLCQIEM